MRSGWTPRGSAGAVVGGRAGPDVRRWNRPSAMYLISSRARTASARGVAGVPRLKVERELPLVRGEQRAQDDAERDAVLEIGRHLLDRQQIGEREQPVAAGRVGADQSPLLQIAQMIVGDRRVEASNVASGVGPVRR